MAIFGADGYAYGHEIHKFFKNTRNVNASALPYADGHEGWRLVEEDKFTDGLVYPEIVISVSGGDVAIRPLYYYCEQPDIMTFMPELPGVSNTHGDLNNYAYTHKYLSNFSHSEIFSKV